MGCKAFLGSLGKGWMGLTSPGCYCLGGCGHGWGIWGGLWFSCGIARCGSVSIFQWLSGSIGLIFVLGVGVGAGLGGPMGF